ncbi:sulfurtransferase [Salinicoccus siamensis]|uniref:Sulfurtransferase n=1 Tax=Salinicoccus siamensis TaxID=381830 RepID=A0ABV5Z1E4_9STAP
MIIDSTDNNLRGTQFMPIDCRNVMDDLDASAAMVADTPYLGLHIPQKPWMFTSEGLNEGRHPIPPGSVVGGLYDALKQDTDAELLLLDKEDAFFHTRLYYLFQLYGFHAMLWNDACENLKDSGLTLLEHTPSFPDEVDESREVQPPDVSMLATLEDVEHAVGIDDVLLIDVRAHNRYLGDTEPIDFKKGHIPGAVNIPYSDVFESGRLNITSLEHLRPFLSEFRELIVYCGSGMSATPPYYVLESMDLPVRLYGGSFSEWIRHHDVETGVSTMHERMAKFEG